MCQVNEFQKVNACVPPASRPKHRASLGAPKPLRLLVTAHTHEGEPLAGLLSTQVGFLFVYSFTEVKSLSIKLYIFKLFL